MGGGVRVGVGLLNGVPAGCHILLGCYTEGVRSRGAMGREKASLGGGEALAVYRCVGVGQRPGAAITEVIETWRRGENQIFWPTPSQPTTRNVWKSVLMSMCSKAGRVPVHLYDKIVCVYY